MDLKITGYKDYLDGALLQLFYKSIFNNKKEFDYVRVPERWIFRYNTSNNFIVKIATLNGEIIASLGLLIRYGVIDDRKVKIGCFVDNCILPEYEEYYEEVFSRLYKDIEHGAVEMGVDVIQGWDFIENIAVHRTFYNKLGFVEHREVNWFSSAITTSGDYPYKWEAKISMFWRIFFRIMMYHIKLRSYFIGKVQDDVIIRPMRESDIDNVYKMIATKRNEYLYSSEDFLDFQRLFRNKIINGIVAENKSKLIGVLTYITSAWGGWMFNKPIYDVNAQTFFGFTPDEFIVFPDYQDTNLAAHMILFLMGLNSSDNKDNYFIASIFDRNEGWKRRAFQKVGFTEPKFDHGAILAKSLNKNIKLDSERIWNLPARYILAPVPSGRSEVES